MTQYTNANFKLLQNTSYVYVHTGVRAEFHGFMETIFMETLQNWIIPLTPLQTNYIRTMIKTIKVNTMQQVN